MPSITGGELQRFAIAVVAAQAADIYMIDEPSSYLDVRQRLKAAQVKKALGCSCNGVSCVCLLTWASQAAMGNALSPCVVTPSCKYACTPASAQYLAGQGLHRAPRSHLVQRVCLFISPLRKLLGRHPCSGRFHSKARALRT